MRANTEQITVTTVNFTGNDSASYTWNAVEARDYELTVDGYADAHRENASDAEYVAEYGVPEVFEYELPGLRVVALLLDGELFTMFVVADVDLERVHTALRSGRSMTIRYVKADGEVTRRRVEPQSLRLSKAGDVILRAADRRRDGETRSFRWDRVTHTTLHRDRVTPTPTKDALWAEFQRTLATVGQSAIGVSTPATEEALPLPGTPVVRWTPNPDRPASPLTATGRCLDPSGSHARPVNGRCPVCAAVAHYA